MMSGTRNVGSRLSGNARKGAIPCQSFEPDVQRGDHHRDDVQQSNQIPRQQEPALTAALRVGIQAISATPAVRATVMSPIPPGNANVAAEPSGRVKSEERDAH